MAEEFLKVGSQKVKITNPDKILFPKAKLTKQDFIDYYRMIAPIMLAHIKNRPITMNRFPNGVGKPMFYQKDAGEHIADWVDLQPVEKSNGEEIEYILANNQATIVYLANLVCVPHVWLSRAPKLNYPDRMIFDFDPSPGAGFTLVKWAAKELKKLLEKLDLPSFLMTTGSRGLHVVVPIKRLYLFDEVRACAQQIAQILVEQYPSKLTLAMRKSARGKKVFIDTLRNSWSATAVAPYAVRAKQGAPIATPIKWSELAALKNAQKYTIKNITARISKVGDVWDDIDKNVVGLKSALKKIKSY